MLSWVIGMPIIELAFRWVSHLVSTQSQIVGDRACRFGLRRFGPELTSSSSRLWVVVALGWNVARYQTASNQMLWGRNHDKKAVVSKEGESR